MTSSLAPLPFLSPAKKLKPVIPFPMRRTGVCRAQINQTWTLPNTQWLQQIDFNTQLKKGSEVPRRQHPRRYWNWKPKRSRPNPTQQGMLSWKPGKQSTHSQPPYRPLWTVLSIFLTKMCPWLKNNVNNCQKVKKSPKGSPSQAAVSECGRQDTSLGRECQEHFDVKNTGKNEGTSKKDRAELTTCSMCQVGFCWLIKDYPALEPVGFLSLKYEC